MDEAVHAWWLGLCAVSVGNLLAWSAAAWRLRQAHTWPAGHDAASPFAQRYARQQLALSGVYVAGCAFRSFFPVFDVPRLCLRESWLSTALVGRSVATLAELCFVLQWALLAGALARLLNDRPVAAVARAVPPLIVLAELFSWHAVLTRSNAGHVVEESLWALCAALLVAAALRCWPACAARFRPMLALWMAAALGYIAYMVGVDVPMYWARWQAEAAAGHAPLGLAEGLRHAAQACVQSGRLEDWRSEMVWMGLYFSVAVWFSIGLVTIALPARRAAAAGRVRDGELRASGTAPVDGRLAHAGLSAGVLVHARSESD